MLIIDPWSFQVNVDFTVCLLQITKIMWQWKSFLKVISHGLMSLTAVQSFLTVQFTAQNHRWIYRKWVWIVTPSISQMQSSSMWCFIFVVLTWLLISERLSPTFGIPGWACENFIDHYGVLTSQIYGIQCKLIVAFIYNLFESHKCCTNSATAGSSH